ncbi:E3 ubiquitin-protein ligase RNF13 [Vanrija pseudolonga]|uniref:E3 ubiquitin-protein ligase RNF13 n=1 Tax=Vanrija pseudolonga TaxID=143232 RepID=A0AAF0Y2P1_9TREE|nr:E3 ubiquitin-protein ligase RNF13 [Vanrija pseudolonga]
MHLWLGLLALAAAPPPAAAYVPALPVNDSTVIPSSSLTVKWVNPLGLPGVYGNSKVSYQLSADTHTTNVTQGALVHFTEETMGPNVTSSTPWIAYISCDANETNASQEWDMITLARDRGAVSALLYTLYSSACLLNQNYIQNFEKPLDVFCTSSKDTARLFNSQFVNTNDTYFYFNAQQLNNSASDVNTTLAGGNLPHMSYLAATIVARNDTDPLPTSTAPQPTDSTDSPSGGGKNKGMIAVYVIAGFISAMVCITVFSVIRRSLAPQSQQPEAGPGEPPQPLRRVGLTQAIIDTFPIIKFNKEGNSPRAQQRQVYSSPPRQSKKGEPYKPNESQIGVMLPELRARNSTVSSNHYGGSTRIGSIVSPSASIRDSALYEAEPEEFYEAREVQLPETPSIVSDDQCPICLLEFETGDDLRVLPCEGRHRFHQVCVDPWLLKVSTSCPLCRKDFNPEAIEQHAESSDEDAEHDTAPTRITARYLALIKRARRRMSSYGGERDRTTSVSSARPRDEQTGPGGY